MFKDSVEIVKESKMFMAVFLIIATMIVGSVGFTIVSYNNVNQYEITVTDKEAKTSGESTKYLVFTELGNGETKVFQVTDALFAGRFNSSDVYGSIKVDSSYTVKTMGFRIPILSEYENIMEIK